MIVYADSSLYGRFSNQPDERACTLFLQACQSNRFALVTSDLVENEVLHAHPEVIKLYRQMQPHTTTYLHTTQEVLALRDAYIRAGIIDHQSRNDAQHIALATVGQCDLLTSLDRNDIVKNGRILQFNELNEQWGYAPINILFPAQVLYLR